MDTDDDPLIAGQIEYYRARAPEYDEWFLRQGHYDHGPELAALWEREIGEAAAVLAGIPLDGAEVLEFAPGTGIWTSRYADRAASATAIDAAPEMVERAKVRLGAAAGKVDFVIADIFGWKPSRQYDAVIVCFWLSHVPNARLDEFLATVAGALRPGGHVFFVDSRPAPTSGRTDNPSPSTDGEIHHRLLNDGREFDVVKNFWSSDELRARFTAAGLAADVRETTTYFVYGRAVANA